MKHLLGVLCKSDLIDRFCLGWRNACRGHVGAWLAVVLVSLAGIEVWARDTRTEPWAQGVTPYQRFLLEPHLDAGFRFLRQGRNAEALKEFKRAKEIASTNPMVSLYLAQAYLANGEMDQAVEVLRTQRQLTPDHPEILATIEEYEQKLTDHVIQQAQALKAQPDKLSSFLETATPKLYNEYTESLWMGLLAEASVPGRNLIAQYPVVFTANRLLRSQLILEVLIREDDAYEAKQFIDLLSDTFLTDYPEIDRLSYQLLSKKHPDTALKLLLRAYPFRQATKAQHRTLLDRIAFAQSSAKNKTILRDFLATHDQQFASASEEKAWLRTVYAALPNELDLLVARETQFPQNEPLRKEEIVREIVSGAAVPMDIDPVQLLDLVGSLDPALVDVLSYREIELGHPDHALRILMSRYPFEQNDEAIRLRLMDRLAYILQQQPRLATAALRAQLSRPLASLALRSRQAQMLAGLKDCNGVRRVLGDFSARYSAADWMILGDCYNGTYSGLAQHAYAQAFERQPSMQSGRALAYSAFRNMDYQVAIKAWRYVLAQTGVKPDDLRAAVVTALAAGSRGGAKGGTKSGGIDEAREWMERYDALGGMQHAEYWQLRARIAEPTDLPQAILYQQRSLALEPTAAGYLQLANWQRAAGDVSGSTASLLIGTKLDPKNASLQAELGFAYYRAGEYRDAKGHMEAALAQRPNDTRLIEQLAYTDQRLGENTSAMKYIERAVDYQDSLPAEDVTPAVAEKMFSLRRMHEDLSRRWTFSADMMMGSGPAASVSAPQPGQNYRSYSQVEVDYRLGNPAIDNGRTVSVYGRVFGSSGARDSVWPIYAPMLGVGLRWKPFTEQIIYLAVEKQVPLDHGSSAPANTMIRLSGSFLNDGKRTDDWHPVGPGWWSQNLYLDSAYYLSNQAYSLTADYRLGYHKKIAEGQTIEPYVRGLANKISGETTPDLRVGAGVQWNLWGHQSRYNAYASKTYVALEVQYALKTYQSDRATVLLNMGFRW